MTKQKLTATTVTLLLGALATTATLQTPSTTRTVAFVGAKLFDGTGAALVDPATIVVSNGKIDQVGSSSTIKVPSGAERLDVSGKIITPGLINAHGHVGDTVGLQSDPKFYTAEHIRRQLQLYASYGVTTVFSLGGDREHGFSVRDALSKQPDTARLFVAGDVITGKTPEEARASVYRMADLKADIIKIRVDDNLGASTKMAPEVYRAVIDAAHQRGLRVAAHIFYLDDAKALLKAGVDFIAHSVRDKEVDAELMALLKQRDVCVCPTLTREVSTFVYETRPAFFDDPFFLRSVDAKVLAELTQLERQERYRTSKSGQAYKAALKVASRNLKALVDGGVRIAMGTDTGAPTGRFQGYFEHMELQLMSDAGLTPRQIITAATSDAARCLKMEGRLGTLQPGAAADFVVFGSNPIENIRHTRTLESVWIGGRRVSP
ncbi:MAG: amidohydrolase family protein [Acidobacteria bacterium]|nr:amidohydrolase family protein [Acidobacteriota bacterium]